MKNYWLDRIDKKNKKREEFYHKVIRSNGRNVHYFDLSHLSDDQVNEWLKKLRYAMKKAKNPN
jgi:aromatic ring-opening dioxygenase catalytic subunit (LigB family)